MGLSGRIVGVLRAVDGGVCALFGGYWWESISGTAGRAHAAGRWWGRPLVVVIEAQPWFGLGHCAEQVEKEAALRAIILADRL